MKILSKFKIILLAMTSIISAGSISIVLNSCGHKNTNAPKSDFQKFSNDAQKATPFDIASNATPNIWATAAPSQLSASPTGFQIKENVSISIQLIFSDNGFTKQNSFTIFFNHKIYDAKNWTTNQASDFNTYKAIPEKDSAAKTWKIIYNYYLTNEKILSNINFSTPQVQKFLPNFRINSTTFIENAKKHTIDLQVNIIQGTGSIIVPTFSYNIDLIATWSGREFSISDWTYNYNFKAYTTTLSMFLVDKLEARELIKDATDNDIHSIRDLVIGKVTIDNDKKTIDITYEFKTNETPTKNLTFEAKMVTDSIKRLGLFGYNKIYGGKKSDNGIGDIHQITPYYKS